jgi:Ca2+-transporting ATPase
MKYIRFQMVVLVGFILAFVGSALFKVAGAALFLPLQILWVNFLIDAPIAMAMGSDTTTPGLMSRKPRKASDPIISRRLGIRLTVGGIVMAALTLVIYQWAEVRYRPDVAQTMALITFSISHIFFALNLRHPYTTVFKMETLTNRNLLYAFGFVILAMILTTELPIFQRIFDTLSLTSAQWLDCLIAATFALVGGELAKLVYKIIKQDKED